ncbi:hypothetical protein BDV24DRAFT_14115 [Aspergillus arachidicola]|uniref:Uncharacterized protein n=1 Tax=Aspergillus arachidicola TaxID=656916 RepID=A0A5N6YGR8_9EURO|nr:hypothetical protein BDV24DRAFT_14115 [Aspergillus arachidicola]
MHRFEEKNWAGIVKMVVEVRFETPPKDYDVIRRTTQGNEITTSDRKLSEIKSETMVFICFGFERG